MSQLGLRYNTGKPGMHLIPLCALKEIARVYDFGSEKYSAHNWQKGLEWERQCMSSLLRHLTEWQDGKDVDDESGLHHDLHIAWNAIALVYMRIKERGIDDRYKHSTTDDAGSSD